MTASLSPKIPSMTSHKQDPLLKSLSLEELKPHPQNPRAIIRRHVVDRIVDGINRAGGFRPNHAITVRQVNGHYEIISGHHRVEAAKAAGLTEVPCWVEEMDDETAFYELIRNNHQGELSPLEIGLHALDYVKLDKRGMGAEGGGLKAYAEGVGYAATNISKYRNAATVFRDFIKDNIIFNGSGINDNASLLTKTNHLGEIQKAPQDCWGGLGGVYLDAAHGLDDPGLQGGGADALELAIGDPCGDLGVIALEAGGEAVIPSLG